MTWSGGSGRPLVSGLAVSSVALVCLVSVLAIVFLVAALL
jgi:hypothetical protein